MLRTLYFSPGKPIRKDIPPQEFPKLVRDRRGLLWVSLINESIETCLPILQGFGFHPLAIDDALQETHVPKLDDWGNYLYIVLNYLVIKENGTDWETRTE